MSQARAPSWWPAAAERCLEDLTSYRLASASECIGRIDVNQGRYPAHPSL